uniref:ADP-dependent glucokinase n=1 Tax=Trichobilharzia regenti TaxID=157069 RepID=A0AA85JXG7_TRIRE|nr:unnamed protein product [Trichobilharzia regenti]
MKFIPSKMLVIRKANSIFISAVALLFIAYWLRDILRNDLPLDIRQVISSLSHVEYSHRPLPQRSPGPKVLVGFGGCVDLRVRALSLFERMKLSGFANKTNVPTTHQRIGSIQDFMAEFYSSFILGAAVERVVHNVTLFKEMVNEASELIPFVLRKKLLSPTITGSHHYGSESFVTSAPTTQPVAWWSLGGNAPVMASRLAREGAQVALAARLSQRQISHLPSGVKVLMAPPDFGLPDIPEEDIHLVLEYESGDKLEDSVAPRANRYILVHDVENPLLSGLWPGLLETWQRHNSEFVVDEKESTTTKEAPAIPDLFVLGGLQVMDNILSVEETKIRTSRINELNRFLSSLPSETLIHFEMASYVNEDFTMDILKTVLPHSDSIGLNEQELPNLVSLLSNNTVTHISTAYPRAANMLDNMRSVWAYMNDPNLPRVNSASGPKWRRLSRLHLHSLAHQIIMVRRHSKGGAVAREQLKAHQSSGILPPRRSDIGLAWPFTRAAVAKASLIAHRHTCAASSIDPVKTRLLVDDSFAVTADPITWKSALQNNNQIPRIKFNHSEPVACWTEPEPRIQSEHNQSDLENSIRELPFDTQIEICIAPVLVCSQVKQTAGAGDNISAAALRTQIVSRS